MVQQMETLNLINKFYGGSFESFIAEYLRSQDLSAVELDLLEKIVKEQRV